MTKTKSKPETKVSDDDLLSAMGGKMIEAGDVVIITFQKSDEGGIEAKMEVPGAVDKSEIPFTPAIIFGETVMRGFKREHSLWPLAKLMVPEAFKTAEEAEADVEAASPSKKKAPTKKSPPKKRPSSK